MSAICSLLGYGNDERKDLLSCGGILIEQLFKAPLTSVLLYPDRTSHVLIHLSVLTISFHKYFKYLWILIISLNLCSVDVHILENDYIYFWPKFTVFSLQLHQYFPDDVDPMSIKNPPAISLLFLITYSDSFQVLALVCTLHDNIKKTARCHPFSICCTVVKE